MDTGVLRSPKRSGRGPYKPVDDFDQTAIRNKIQEFYTVRRQLPTLKNLYALNAFYWYQIFALDFAVVEVQEMFSSHGGHLTNAMYHHGETL